MFNSKESNAGKKLRWVFMGCLSTALCIPIAPPSVQANRLETFVYDSSQNRIEFSLQNDIEPKGVVIGNPTRVVIDLPGITYKGPTVRRRVGHGVQSVRVGQLDASTARLVVEFAPDVNFDPKLLRLKSKTPGRWTMQLPESVASADLNSGAKKFTWPLTGKITAGFGWRVHPIDGSRRLHKGIDIAAPTGAPMFAAGDGFVSDAGWDSGGYGNFVEIKHLDGSKTFYAHANRLLVSKGQQITKGQAIAEVGSTGRSTGPHLHFEVLPDGRNVVDPIDYLPIRQIVLDLASNYKD
jgi:murein DD-endopeptidase MepM/ murein hydrolase activator NlpD